MESPESDSPTSARLAGHIAQGLLALLVLFVLLEATARVVIFGSWGLDPRRVRLISDTPVVEFVTFETDPAIGFQMKPNQDRFMKLVHLKTNSWGMRDREYPVEKPEDTFRVAVVGSSYSVPAGIEIEDAYHSVLEERLSAEHAPTRYEFLNFAVGAHLPSQFLAMLEHRALQFDPDLVIVATTQMAIPLFLLEWNLPPKPAILDRIPHGPRSFLVLLARSRLSRIPERRGLKPPRFPLRKSEGPDVIERLAQVSRDTGIPIVVFRIAYDPRTPMPVERVIERRVVDAGMYYLDSRQAFAGVEPRRLWIHELDPHPNEAAHARFAEVMAAFLAKRGLIGL